MNTLDFLDKVITSPESGHLLLAIRNHTITWHEEFHQWPTDKDKVASRLELLHDSYDVYFSPHLFAQEESTKDNVLSSRTIQADLDAATEYPLEPTILVQTSPQRYQGYWILKYDCEPEDLERLSKRITYSISNSDHSGWSLGHRVRVPGTLNYKYKNGPHEVSILSTSEKIYTPEEIELLPAVPAAILAIHDNSFIDTSDAISFGTGPFEMVQTLQGKIPNTVYHDYMNKIVGDDRSSRLWALECALFEAGLTKEQVFWVARHSANNKFAADQRYNSDRELAKDVLNAEQKVKVKPVDVRAAIDAVRNVVTPNIPGGALYKRRQILGAVKFAMEHTGKFVRVVAGLPYFIPNDTGRPIPLTTGSEHFRALLHLKYGINSADPEYKHVHDGIIDEGISLEHEIQESSLSYYSGGDLYFHPGRRDVLKINAEGITHTNNAECGVLFPWYDVYEPFVPDLANPYPNDWGDLLFGDLHNTSNMTPIQAKALLKSWMIFSLFRSEISTRPILAFLGPPGSAKSTLPHRIYALLYARRLAVSGLTGANDFDTTSAKLPVYCVDNLDSYVGWIIDKLAQAISNIDIVTRKLFTDTEMIRKRRQAMLVVTAHNPKFTREDVTSRLLLITLDEIKKSALLDETPFIDEIIKYRAQLWGAIIYDVVRVLNTPRPASSTIKWRIQDFASIGEWIAIALGYQDEFNSGLSALLNTQSTTIIQQEELLSQALMNLNLTEPVTSQQLWDQLLIQVGGNQASFVHTYKNAIRLQQKLMTMRSALSSVLDITQETNVNTHIKKWMISHKNGKIN